MSDLPLDQHQIDLWYVRSDRISDPGLVDHYRSHLPAEEVEQQERFALEESQHQFLLARAMVRWVLSHYTGDDFRAWQFKRNPYGKPAIAAPEGMPLEFNLSHTRGLVCCAVTLGRAVGVDVEDRVQAGHGLALARRYFAPAEVAWLERLPADQQPGAFLELWTLKEAFLKARGMGLSRRLDSFAFLLAEDRPPTVSATGAEALCPDQWQFARLRLHGRYQVALAVELPVGQRLVVQVRETLPLRWCSQAQVLPFDPCNRWAV